MSGDKGKSDKSRVRRGHFQVDLSGSGLLEGRDVGVAKEDGMLGELRGEREDEGEGNGVGGSGRGRGGNEFACNNSVIIIV